jgi:hypothetical protein
MSNCLRFKVSYIHGKNVKTTINVWKQRFHNFNWNVFKKFTLMSNIVG